MEDRLAILINADPDALASALALKRIFWRKAKKIEIYHVNPIERPDNLSLIRLLGIKTISFRQLKRSTFTKWALVDSQPNHHDSFKKFDFDVIIDHHPAMDGVSARHLDIKEDYGATATLMTEYLKSEKIKPSPRVATALFYGIKTDTNNFVRESSTSDINAFRYVYRFANMNIIKKVESSEMTLKTLDIYRSAMKKLTIIDDTAIVGMGRIKEAAILVILADFFLKLAEASWTIVSGVMDQKLVVVFRNAGIRGNAGKLARQLFGEFGSAGGHRDAARAEIPLENIRARSKDGIDDHDFVLKRTRKNPPAA